MRGRQDPQASMLALIDVDSRVPAQHPLRTIRALADTALAELSPEFDRCTRPSAAPRSRRSAC